MTITHLEIIDFKRIRAMEIDPKTGQPIVLTGDNAQGKSSVLDAIQVALENKGAERPIRDGANSSTIRVTLADGEREFEVRRRFTSKGSYLDITSADGKKVPQAQTFLNGVVGEIAFDPEEFARMKPKEQANALRDATGLKTDDLDEKRKELFARRTEVNRAKKEAEAQIDAIPIPDSDVPADKTSIASLVANRDAVEVDMRDWESRRKELRELHRQGDDMDERISDLELELESLRAERKSVAAAAAASSQRLLDQIDVDAMRKRMADINAELANAEENNAEADAHNRNLELWQERKARYRETVKASQVLTRDIEKLDREKAERIAAAQMPVDNMEISDDGVIVDGIPFSDLNTAERIKISTLVAMAMNPTLKVIFVREGALINRANMQWLINFAAEHGYLIIIEKFQEEPGTEGLHIEDGNITHIDGEPVVTATTGV